nr:MAG TPA: GIY-YIG nuclease superfamily protein [Caudoviricetes sp.]
MKEKIYFIYKYEWDDGSVYIGQTYHGSGRYGNIGKYAR